MRYLGSKNRLSKELAPIIQGYINETTTGYIEPFVGGANMIDKIKHKNKIGYDIHKELIELLKKARDDAENIPELITEEEYKSVKQNKESYEKWYVGLVGFCASFGAKYFGGYARDNKNDNSGKWSKSAINNLKKQAPQLKGIKFYNSSFLDLSPEQFEKCVIYCDIPYKGTSKYATETFPYDEFYKWAKELAKNNTVLISEYAMPDGFECVWQKETIVNFDSARSETSNKKRVEKLFIVKECN